VTAEGQNQSGWRKLARDVGVNVVANLLAAAVIYMAAVAGGYLQSNEGLMKFALLLVLTAVFVLAVTAVWELADRFGWWGGVPAAVILSVILVCALSSDGFSQLR
jgi:glucose-6-phosphate-specific signal transduction histidine kinase